LQIHDNIWFVREQWPAVKTKDFVQVLKVQIIDSGDTLYKSVKCLESGRAYGADPKFLFTSEYKAHAAALSLWKKEIEYREEAVRLKEKDLKQTNEACEEFMNG